ncbi:MAG TPA: protein phosphatase 2C domain-containing protein [Vicinamibacterales bacterium]|nr:protein phosphatase 2C domain-containing protein [Vicinamibacterales bacterium]
MRLTAAGATDRGPRAVNQDALFVDLDLGLLMVADGMGGHNAGEVASRMAIDAVVNFMRATHDGGEITWPFPFNPRRSRALNRMDAALRLANQAVYAAGERNRAHAGMGTTIVAALVEGAQLVIGHVGDSRAYVLRDEELLQMTEDHSLVNALGGHVMPDVDQMRHVLTSGIGMGIDLSPALAEVALVAGERWLLCSDGVHGYLDAAGLRTAMRARSAQEAADDAVRRALGAGTADNVTAVVLNVDSTGRV